MNLNVMPVGLFFEFDPTGGLAEQSTDVIWSSPQLLLRAGRLLPLPRLYQIADRIVVLCGHPIIDGRRDDEAVIEALYRSKDDASFALSLDGSFIILIHDPSRRALRVINDRFAGYALYYWNAKNRLVGGVSFRDVLLHARRQGGGQIDEENIQAFIWLRRLLGEGTLARDVKYLRAGVVLFATSGNMQIEPYWQPNFYSEAPKGKRLVEELTERLRSAVSAHMSDDYRFGLMLSGGLDSRALLASTTAAPVCFTTGLSRNNEFEVAAEAARLVGAKHHFLQRQLTIYDDRLNEATGLAGMQVFNEAQFLGYGNEVKPLADVVMVGLGLDVFFGGLYLPKVPSSFLGRQALHHRLLPLPRDMANFYLHNVKYRLKTSNPMSVMTVDVERHALDQLRAQVDLILNRGRALGAKGYSLWEYMHFHNMSRHYSFPMLASVRTYVDCRAPAFSNDLFDLAIAMEANDKLNGTPYQQAIKQLSPQLMDVRNANTNLPAGWSLRRQTWAKAGLYCFYRLGLTEKGRPPAWQARSWPMPRMQLEASPKLMEKVNSLPTCSTLAMVNSIDSGKLRALINQHMQGQHDHTVLLNLLLTLSSVLRPADKD